MKELEPINVVNLNTIIQLIMKKRFLITILLMLVLAVAAQAQEKKGFDWKKMTVGTEFVHNITKGYYFGNNSILLDHPNNSVDIRVMYDLGRYWTLGVYAGSRFCHVSSRGESYVQAANYEGYINRTVYVNESQAMFGIEADLHLLPLIGADSPWYDIYAIGRIGSTTQDLDMTIGLGFAYWPWKWGCLYGNVGTGSAGFPYGFLDVQKIRLQVRTGISIRL